MKTLFDMLNGFQLMADGLNPVGNYGDGDQEEIEYVVVDPSELSNEEEETGSGEDTGEVKVTKEQYDELLGKGNSAETLNQGLANLAEVLKGQGKGTGDLPEQQQSGESDEEFKERISKDLFEDGKTYGSLTEAMRREFGPVFNQLAAGTVKLQKKMLRNDPETGEYFKKYEKDIDKFVEKLPVGQRMNPEVYEYAYKQVMQDKQPEVLESELAKREDEIFEKKLSGLGLKYENGNIVSNNGEVAVYGATGGIGSSGKPKKQVKVSREEYQRLSNIGIDIKDAMEYGLIRK